MTEVFNRERYFDRQTWLYGRNKPVRFGGSDAPSICDESPWRSAAELYDEKVGLKPVKDLSGNKNVEYGIKVEPLLRENFLLDNPFFSLEYCPYDILVSKERPYMTATLDGELTVIDEENPWGLPVGSRGVLECKTGSFRRESDLDEWLDGVPQHYYIQCLHQLSVTGWDFVIVPARLHRDPYKDSDNGFPDIRCFYRMIDRRAARTKEDIGELEVIEKKFYESCLNRKRPPVRLEFGGYPKNGR